MLDTRAPLNTTRLLSELGVLMSEVKGAIGMG